MLLNTQIALGEKQLIRRFWQSASGFWRGPSAWRAWLLCVLLIATVLLQLAVQFRINFWNRDFFNAIERKDGAELWRQALIFLPLAVASLTLAILSVWSRMTMQRTWRAWLSNHLYDYWLGNGHSLRLQFMSGEHRNPEYRIAEDARVATDLPIDLTLGLVASSLTAITFIGVLWSVGGGLDINVFGLNVAIPGYLVIAVVIYSMLMTAAMMLIAHHLTRVMQDNKRAEAELRAVGAHLRESGEGTALPDGKHGGRRLIGAALDEVVAQWLAYCWQLMRIAIVSQSRWCKISVRSPSGRLRLATTPALIGSEPVTKTIGIVEVAALAASAEGMPPAGAMTETLRPTRSDASAGNRS